MSSRNRSISAVGQLAPVAPVAGGPLEQRVVDVGDVLHVVHLVAGVAQRPPQEVEGDVGGRVAEVGGVVGGDAADVEPRDRPGVDRAHGTALRVEQLQRVTVAGHGGDEGSGPRLHRARLRADDYSAGHGMAGQPGCGTGCRRERSSASVRDRRARTSAAGQQGFELVGEPVAQGARAGSRARARSASGTGSPAQPHSTVRSFGSTPQADPVVAPAHDVAVAQQVAALAVGVVEHGVEHGHGAQRGLAAVRHDDRPAARQTRPRAPRPSPSGTSYAGSDVDERLGLARRPGRPTAAPIPARAGRCAAPSAARRRSRPPRLIR